MIFLQIILHSAVNVYDFDIFITSSSFHGFITNQFNNLLLAGLFVSLILVERCSGITFATSKVPYVTALIFLHIILIFPTIWQIFCPSPLLLMHIWCQTVPLWITLEHSNFSFRLQPHSPIEVTSKIWTSIIPFSSEIKDLHCLIRPCTAVLHGYKQSHVFFDWQYSHLKWTLILSGAS